MIINSMFWIKQSILIIIIPFSNKINAKIILLLLFEFRGFCIESLDEKIVNNYYGI